MLATAGYLYFSPNEAEAVLPIAVYGAALLGVAIVSYFAWPEFVSSLADTILGGLLSIIASFVFMLSGMIFRWAVFLFEKSLEWSVIFFSRNVEEITMIDTGWTIIRDAVNVAFIFILLYIAISIILQFNAANAKQMLIRVIVAALLINFSLFATKVVIDASNILALEFFNAIGEPVLSAESIPGGGVDGSDIPEGGLVEIKGPAAVILAGLNFQTLLSEVTPDDQIAEDEQQMSYTSNALLYIGGTILLWILIFVFGALALLFLVRFVMLIFYMIFSPIGFLGILLPQFGSIGNKWWNGLLKQAFFAPAALFMLYLVARMIQTESILSITSVAGGANEQSLSAAIQGDVNHFGTLMNFFIIMAFTAAALVVSQNIGAYGTKATLDMAHRVRKGTQSFAGSRTIGRAAARLDDRLGESRFGNTFVGSSLRNITTQKLKKTKFGGKTSGEDFEKSEQKRKGKLRDVRSRYPAEKRERITRPADERKKTTDLQLENQRAESRSIIHDAKLKEEAARQRQMDMSIDNEQRKAARLERREQQKRAKGAKQKFREAKKKQLDAKHNVEYARKRGRAAAQKILQKQRKRVSSPLRSRASANEERNIYKQQKRNVGKGIEGYRQEKDKKNKQKSSQDNVAPFVQAFQNMPPDQQQQVLNQAGLGQQAGGQQGT